MTIKANISPRDHLSEVTDVYMYFTNAVEDFNTLLIGTFSVNDKAYAL